jgi:hypothetical protein
MRKLKIDWMELSAAFESGFAEMHHYLDLETGEVLMVTDEIRWYREEPGAELHGWQQEMVQTARRIEEGYGSRYVQIPQQDSHESYRDMEWFIGTVQDQRLQERLWQAIQGKGTFRYFKDVLQDYPAERERWFAFSDRCVHNRLMRWLEDEEIEPTNPIEPPQVPVPESEELAPEAHEALVEDLTLLLIYLTSWQEGPTPDLSARRAWKGYLFEMLDALEEKGLIQQSRRAKSLYLTPEGIRQAQELEKRYTSLA